MPSRTPPSCNAPRPELRAAAPVCIQLRDRGATAPPASPPGFAHATKPELHELLCQAHAALKKLSMPPPLISICIPAFNARRFLFATLETVRAQTFGDWELIVVEDGSNDGTEGLVASFAASVTQHVRYQRHEKNLGLPATRNTAIGLAVGEWLALLDSDDLWTPDHLAVLAACAGRQPADLVHSGSILFDSDTGRELGIRAPSPDDARSFPLSLFLGSYIIQPSSAMLTKTLWRFVRGFDPTFRYVEDREMWMRCARAGARFVHTGHNTCLYRKHAAALTTHAGPMAVAAARVMEQAIGWSEIPARLRSRHAAAAWLAAGRIALRAEPRAARGYFKSALRHRPFSPTAQLYWLAAIAIGLFSGRPAADLKPQRA